MCYHGRYRKGTCSEKEMKTPICDFVTEYGRRGLLRLHMPGHKGKGALGVESLDLTEIAGADELYCASGIIAESEKNASELFGCDTFYSTEGSSLCIRAMIYLAVLHAAQRGIKPIIWAGRNAHKTFVSAVALTGAEVKWIASGEGYLSCMPSSEDLDAELCSCDEKPVAVYITSPDYTGGIADIEGISRACRRHGVLLLVDNAHGAYLRFLPRSLHPIDLGAHMCCDSAHKTLPVLTGGAYLHISPDAPKLFSEYSKMALSFFGSTSPSYLILQSLDAANAYIDGGYADRLASFVGVSEDCKQRLIRHRYEIHGDEPLKLTVCPKSYGYEGNELAELLRKKNIECEFSDRDFTVMMLTPDMSAEDIERLTDTLLEIPKRDAIIDCAPELVIPRRVLSLREACFLPSESVAIKDAVGRVVSTVSVSCPPAVPIAVCGEMIDTQMVRIFEYYGITHCNVVKKSFLSDFDA